MSRLQRTARRTGPRPLRRRRGGHPAGRSSVPSGLQSQSGQGFVEYVLIMLLVFVVVIAVLALTGETWGELFRNLGGG